MTGFNRLLDAYFTGLGQSVPLARDLTFDHQRIYGRIYIYICIYRICIQGLCCDFRTPNSIPESAESIRCIHLALREAVVETAQSSQGRKRRGPK